jgi:hypothetical protein
MPDSLTTNRSYVKPEDGASEDTWGAKLNNDWDAVDDDIYALLTTANFGVNSGTANALAVTLEPVLQSLVAGQRVYVKVAADNTSGVTLAADSTGIKTCKLNDGSALTAGVLKAGGIYGFIYDGTDYRLAERASASTAILLAGTDNAQVATPAGLAGLITESAGVIIEKKPGGYMTQSGKYAGGSSNPTITFPVAFTAAPHVQITAYGTGANTNSASNSVALASLASVSTTGFSAWVSSESEVSDVFVNVTNVAFEWVAIGKVATA